MPSTEIVMATSIPATGLVSKMSDVTSEKSFTSADDCFSGGTDPALTTYEACCQPLLMTILYALFRVKWSLF